MAQNKQSLSPKELLPIVVLVATCAAAGLLLGLVHELTTPLVEENRQVRAAKMYAELIPEAEEFVPCELDSEQVTACMEARPGKGWIIVAQEKGYGGFVSMAVAFNPDGSIRRVQALQNNETPGLGTKVADDFFIEQFASRPAEELELSDIDAITGATISSRAALGAINDAIAQFVTTSSVDDTKGGTHE